MSLSLSDNRMVVVALSAAATGSVVTYLLTKYLRPSADPKERRELYETVQSNRQYMEFHFTPGKDSFPYALTNVSEAFDFPIRVAAKFNQFKPAKFGRVLDLGCAVGASSFELSKYFNEVVGIDLSERFIQTANEVKSSRKYNFEAPDQGYSSIKRQGSIPADTKPERVTFVADDALALGTKYGTFDGLLAANLVCRVPDPTKLIESFAHLINQGGILVLASPYSWMEAATNPTKWLGGHSGGRRSEDIVKEMLQTSFVLVSESNEPFFIRDHHRRFQLGFSHTTIWRRK